MIIFTLKNIPLEMFLLSNMVMLVPHCKLVFVMVITINHYKHHPRKVLVSIAGGPSLGIWQIITIKT